MTNATLTYSATPTGTKPWSPLSTWGAGNSFYVYIDVINVTDLLGYACGFYFNNTYLTCTNVTDTGWLTAGGDTIFFGGTGYNSNINNSNGTVTVCTEEVYAPVAGPPYFPATAYLVNGSGAIMKVGFKINSAAAPYTPPYPGSPVMMMEFSLTEAPVMLELSTTLGTGDCTPTNTTSSSIYNGFFTLQVVPRAPVAALVIAGLYHAPSYAEATNATPTLLDASGSTPGWTGLATNPISWAYFTFGDGSPPVNVTAAPFQTTHKWNVSTFGPPWVLGSTAYEASVEVGVAEGTEPPTLSTSSISQQVNIVAKIVKPPELTPSPATVSLVYNPSALPVPIVPGYTFNVYVNADYVANLLGYQIGFTFDASALQVLSVVDTGWLGSNGGTAAGVNTPTGGIWLINGSIDNIHGIVSGYTGILLSPSYAVSSNPYGSLLNVTFEINPTLWPPYTGTYPGSPTMMMNFSTADSSPFQSIITNASGTILDFSLPGQIVNGTFQLDVVPILPTAVIGITPNPAFVGQAQTFYAGASLPGNSGYGPSTITTYIWDSNVTGIETVLVTTPAYVYTFSLPVGVYNISLIVVNAQGYSSAPAFLIDVVNPLPSGCNIDVTTQTWRYIDPIWLLNVPNGAGTDTQADLFRPGDYVQLFAYTSYNLDPVANQLVSFEVLDNHGLVVAAGTAITNASGVAEYDFRVPWPSTNVQLEFGAWRVYASWQCGAMTGYAPYENTQVDYVWFLVGWGLYIQPAPAMTLNGVPFNPVFYKGNLITGKINVVDQYLENSGVPALATLTLFDNLDVPIGTTSFATTFFIGTTTITFTPIQIPNWAFVGPNCAAKADLFSTWPAIGGTSYCPEVVEPFTIHS
jgi:hypothetical protein